MTKKFFYSSKELLIMMHKPSMDSTSTAPQLGTLLQVGNSSGLELWLHVRAVWFGCYHCFGDVGGKANKEPE